MLWRPHHLIRAQTNFDFLGKRKIALILSTAINVLSLVGVLVFGLNFGIDFEGGIAIQVRAKQGTDPSRRAAPHARAISASARSRCRNSATAAPR